MPLFEPCKIRQQIIVALVYIAVAEVSIFLSINNIGTAIIWPAAGIAFAAIVRHGPHVWLGIAVGSFIANIHFFIGRDPSLEALLIADLGVTLGNVIAPLRSLFPFPR